ncbi:helix-turn-helix transcriptional regulator [Aggregicoccus sp. 17bor-14]|uniref:helix-turn-helix transcriptional regulator n=1 Tax=Myxococcaceae TaxID=31 RepID=UPI0012F0C2ED|nr:helix-turn-helix transcriptional regulator [Simulacricoccus sp. 17bor-14]MRI89408.1 helix-turn-helix transcriptional regulator [Aggregicoccus sp. 17bor-14]
MQAAGGLEDYARAPVGRYLGGEGHLHWTRGPALCGLILWGRPDEAQLQRITRVLDVELPPAPPHASLVDARRLEGVDPGVFARFAHYMGARAAGFGASVQRQALVRPQGLVGALVAGFYALRAPAYPVRVFEAPEEALAWLGCTDAPALARQLDALWTGEAGESATVRALGEALRADLAQASLARAARALGLSERTLQRRLQLAGTTFQAELHRAQVRCAQALLRDSDLKLTAIALEVGCASLQHFSGLFRRLTGESPSHWRARARARATAGPG